MIRALLVAAALFTTSAAVGGEAPYTELFYSSGTLRIQAYLYRPEGAGPFPVVIYNHGSRDGRERESLPFRYIGTMLTGAGYAVLVPERRGYGKSDGALWWQEAANNALVARLQAETDDVLAGLEYLRALEFVDKKRAAIIGWSFGGIVTMLAISRSNAFAAAVDQAGGALTWDGNPTLRAALVAAAEKATTPTLFMVAKNDRTTASITTLAEIYAKRGIAHEALLYAPFTPPQGRPGHSLFSAQGANIWERDVVQFLNRYLAVRGH